MDHTGVNLSIVVPAFNEEKRIESPLDEVVQYLRSRFDHWELIYSDDGSTDKTLEKLRRLQERYPEIKIVAVPKNRGKGSAVRIGMSAASGNVILFSDTDFSTPIQEAERLFRYLDDGYDVAIGSRGLSDSQVEVHQAWAREMMGKMFNAMLRSLLPIEFKDTQCGFKMFSRKAVDIILPKMHLESFAFDVEMLIIAQANRLRIAEVPVIWRNVLDSRVHPIRNSMEMIRDVLKVRHRLAMNLYS
ncbi:glycosyltransferase family 2 protein [bacterium]|nr:glycosyltransferase family 2 protein [bacterium]